MLSEMTFTNRPPVDCYPAKNLVWNAVSLITDYTVSNIVTLSSATSAAESALK
jgi:hypothetical protein